MATHLMLTGLALFTDARYTRSLSQADLHAAFQDRPGALEHFPTGALVSPHIESFQVFNLFFLTVFPYAPATVMPVWRAAIAGPDAVMRL